MNAEQSPQWKHHARFCVARIREIEDGMVPKRAFEVEVHHLVACDFEARKLAGDHVCPAWVIQQTTYRAIEWLDQHRHDDM